MSNSSRRTSDRVLPMASPFQRSISPSGRLCSSLPANDSSPSTSSTSSGFCPSPSSGEFHRATSPTRVNLHGFSHPSPSVRFSISRSSSPNRSITSPPRDHVVKKQSNNTLSILPKKTCMCSPTTHPGSFRCGLHKNSRSISYILNSWRSTTTNSFVRIVIEGDLVNRAFAVLIRPSSHQQRRRVGFQSRPSLLSIMSKVDDY